MRALVEAISRKMGLMYSTFDLNFAQAFLDGAEGQFLSFIGDMMGVSRLGETPATVTSDDRNVKFVVDIGNFGDINGAASITITSGTIISTQAGGAGLRYRVVVDTVLPSGDDEAFVSVQAVRTGSQQNVGRNQLKFHDFTGYTDVLNDTLKVTNDADVITGGDLETDTNYRFRIANQTLAAEQANLTAIRLAGLTVPGVADVVLLPFSRGIGTYDVLVQSITPTASADLISSVQTSITAVTSHGVVGRSRGPEELGMALVGTLTYRRLLSAEEETNILQSVTANVTDYINGLDIGEEFVVQEAVERVLSTSDVIKKVGTTTKPFDNLFLFRPSALDDNKVRSTLIDDFDPEEDERLIVENRFAGAAPILFRSA
jgi:uncharacterized phage protein gp47/JayE